MEVFIKNRKAVQIVGFFLRLRGIIGPDLKDNGITFRFERLDLFLFKKINEFGVGIQLVFFRIGIDGKDDGYYNDGKKHVKTDVSGFIAVWFQKRITSFGSGEMMQGSGINFRFQHADVRQITVFFIIVKPVADNESIGNFKAGIVRINGSLPACGLIQQGDNGDGGRFTDLQIVFQIIERDTGIQDILYEDDMPAADIAFQVFLDTDSAGGICAAVGRNSHEFNFTVNIDTADQVRHEHETAFQHANKNGILFSIVIRDFAADLMHFIINLFMGKQGIGDVIFHSSQGVPHFLITDKSFLVISAFRARQGASHASRASYCSRRQHNTSISVFRRELSLVGNRNLQNGVPYAGACTFRNTEAVNCEDTFVVPQDRGESALPLRQTGFDKKGPDGFGAASAAQTDFISGAAGCQKYAPVYFITFKAKRFEQVVNFFRIHGNF